ncbi:MAG: phosphoribosylglycinamide formyltransferase [Erysipelotrichaceae bacterium]|nr:phosphoribosylglycinamide formyltransferase [Erysipelotrichaceae bacterium]MDY5251741.1 phosphoribosylglycinamide formyltransferase [Erysipelotrichaceae bacterium]
MIKIAVFASGTGSNFDAILENIHQGKLQAELALMVCDKPAALVVEKAKKANIPSFVFNPKDYPSKAAYDQAILEACRKAGVEMIILAGYMRIVSEILLRAYPNKIINIHPSLLPAFKGKDAIKQAYDYGVKVMGVSVHYVNEDLDGGDIIAQKAFACDGMSLSEAECNIHAIEHQLYPQTIQKLIEEER